MFNKIPFKFFGKGRKYPIKKDEYGQSARKRAFLAFDEGKMPAEIAKEIDSNRGRIS